MKKRTKGRIREFEHTGMRQSTEQYRTERRERMQPEPEPVVVGRKKKRLKLNKGRLILTVIVLSLIAVIGVSVKNIFDLRAEQDALKKHNKNLIQTEQSLEEELKNVNDLDYIEEQARIQLRMIKPGEILYIMEEEDGRKEADGKETDGKEAGSDDDKDDKEDN